jgi:hypothetical protein
MARRNVALAQPRQAPAKKRRSRGSKRNLTLEAERPPAAFDDLEQAFFAAAPPDEAAPAAAPECFDDLVAAGPAPRDPLAAVRRALGAARAALRRLFAPAGAQRAARK